MWTLLSVMINYCHSLFLWVTGNHGKVYKHELLHSSYSVIYNVWYVSTLTSFWKCMLLMPFGILPFPPEAANFIAFTLFLRISVTLRH